MVHMSWTKRFQGVSVDCRNRDLPPSVASRRMAAEIRVVTVRPCLTAVVATSTSWAGFPNLWPSMLDAVWDFLSSAPDGLYDGGHNVMLY